MYANIVCDLTSDSNQTYINDYDPGLEVCSQL